MSEFEKMNRIGEGAYGIVCKYNLYSFSLKNLTCIYSKRQSKRYYLRTNCCFEKSPHGSRT